MKVTPASVAPVALALVLVGAFIGVLAATRPDGEAAPAAAAAAAEATASRTRTSTPAPSRTATATATRTPTPTVPVPTTSPPTAGRPLGALSGLRLVDTAVIENPDGIEVFLPPGMPIEVVIGMNAAGEASYFFTAPPPFATMNGKSATGFDDSGGSGTATGAGRLGEQPATFTLEFSITEHSLHGTLRIIESGTGALILILAWSGGGPAF